jgi:hypothetical protein
MVFWIRATAGLVLAMAIAAFGATSSFAGEQRDAAAPSVRVTTWQPLVLVGTRFRPSERVMIRVFSAGSPTVVRRVRTTARGTFRVMLAGATIDRCNGPSIVVTGAGGRVAKVRLPLPLCPPAP